jgi:hypothetical protein
MAVAGLQRIDELEVGEQARDVRSVDDREVLQTVRGGHEVEPGRSAGRSERLRTEDPDK